jgi:hypothetical protein
MKGILKRLRRKYSGAAVTYLRTGVIKIEFDLSEKGGGSFFNVMCGFDFNNFRPTFHSKKTILYKDNIHVHFKVLSTKTFKRVYRDRCFGMLINVRTGEVESCQGRKMRTRAPAFSGSYHAELASFMESHLNDPREQYFVYAMTVKYSRTD